MKSPVADIELLLAGSRELLELEELDLERLEAWRAERNAIFCRLKEHHPVLASADGFLTESLLEQLLDADAKICGRVAELQTRLAKQIAAAKTMRQALPRGSSRPPHLLQRTV
jgi:hypothetical protein